MEKRKKQAGIIFRVTALVLPCTLLFSGCQPSSISEAVTGDTELPQPSIQITHAVNVEAVESLITSTPAPTLLPPPGISDLANELFGERLIKQISIPALHIDSAVTTMGWKTKNTNGEDGGLEWDSPGPDVGWVITSALPDESGNILLYGHNNLFTEVFKKIGNLKCGDKIYLQTSNREWVYEVQQVIKIAIRGTNEEQREDYKKYMAQTQDQRLTLISCWPPISNTHRIIVIARPSQK
ncbi:MAG: hypothetical protein B6243_09555 [Anaerolineaceae bacterium 4572_5.2]|nr:MAG: hypothetical protein B6243_09555 [Anaerolineaceae bacterium 4572_5.2]